MKSVGAIVLLSSSVESSVCVPWVPFLILMVVSLFHASCVRVLDPTATFQEKDSRVVSLGVV